MSDNELLLAISGMLDSKLDATLVTKLDTMLDEKLDAMLVTKLDAMLDAKLDTMLVTKLDAMLDEKLDTKLDAKLAPIENRVKRIEVDLLENNVLPRLNMIESCYIDTFKRYKDSTEQMSAIADDVALLKKVVAEHSEKLQAIS